MSNINFMKMSYPELLAHAEYAVDWLETHGFTLQDVLDLRKQRQGRHFMHEVILAWTEINNMSVKDLQKFQGMCGDIGREL